MTQLRFLTRKRIIESLKIGQRVYDRVFPARDRLPVSEQDVIDKLNDCRVALPKWTGPGLPEIESADEVVARQVAMLNGKPVTKKQLHNMCRRTHNPIPHFRLAPYTFLFPDGVVEWWMSFIGSGVYVDWRKFNYGDRPRIREVAI